MLSRFFSRFLTQDIAMDLGTANTLLYTRKHGIFINEPSVVAVDAVSRKVLAVGAAAKEYLGRTPQNICAIRPMKDGVIADFDITREMIAHFVGKCISGLRLVKPSMVICIPTGITQVEKKAVIDAALLSGARSVSLVEEPMAAAIGAGMPVQEPLGNLVLDIGGGTSEVALISMAGIAVSQSVRVAGDAMNLAVQHYLREVFRLEVGENTAENVKKILGAALPQNNSLRLEVSGKDLVYGGPRVVTVTEGDICEALHDPVQAHGALCGPAQLDGAPARAGAGAAGTGRRRVRQRAAHGRRRGPAARSGPVHRPGDAPEGRSGQGSPDHGVARDGAGHAVPRGLRRDFH